MKTGAGAAVVVLILAAAVGSFFWIQRTLAKADAHDALAARVEQLEVRHEALSEEILRRADLEAALRGNRATISRNLDEAAHEDPVARDYLSEPIPERVRDAIRDPQL